MDGKWEWVDNYNADPRGRIWILWDPNKVHFRVDVVHKQFIHGYVMTQSLGFYLTGVYGMHTIANRQHLWTGLTHGTNTIADPLVIMGDFKSILHRDDRIGAEHLDCIGVVRTGWRGVPHPTMRGVWRNLKKVKMPIQKLNTNEFKGVTKKVNKKRQHLMNLQSLMSDPLTASRQAMDEKQCKCELESVGF
ncbi:hypothetical protein KY284_036090 [Solanum tuberosum]|nr:hypothetical protein KY284_036090 [Solanum tuberosum]